MKKKASANSGFALHDLGLAYRKAKVDLYYATHSCLKDIVDYEENLNERLKDLLSRLNGKDESWLEDKSFLGDYVLVPSGLEATLQSLAYQPLIADPARQWRLQLEQGGAKSKPKIEFRLMAHNSIDFHVLSALWLLHVGHVFDSCLKESAYGNRLRRTEKKRFNTLSLGSFQPYLKPYRDWRDDGITAIREALVAKKHVVALSADIKSYYHRLKPDFMLEHKFLQSHGIELDDKQKRLHRLFITALKGWAKQTPLGIGLPVGLPASAVIANLALLALDKVIASQLTPLYYGRYVDDVILVLENTNELTGTEDLWKWLVSHSKGLLVERGSENIDYQPSYLNDCQIEFSTKKTRVFILDPKHGPYLVDSILRHIQERASEWRALPSLPETAEAIKTDIVQALNSNGEAADSLGKADTLSARRAAFAIKLRDFEAYARDLPPSAWGEQRHALFDVAIEHILIMPDYLGMALYLPRLIRLATACEDFCHLRKMLEALEKLVSTVTEYNHFCIKGRTEGKELSNGKIVLSWTDYLKRMLKDSVQSAFPFKPSSKAKSSWCIEFVPLIKKGSASPLSYIAGLNLKELEDEQRRFFEADLAYHPFRYRGLPVEVLPSLKLPSKKQLKAYMNPASFLSPQKVVDGLRVLADWTRLKRGAAIPAGLLFATRPFTLVELYLLDCRPFHEARLESLSKVVLALRGFRLTPKWPTYNKQGVLRIPDGNTDGRRRIALSSWMTEERSWVASVMRQPEPDHSRYQRLMTLVDDIVKKNKKLNYLVLPEQSVPCAWYMRLLVKLRNTGISLIAGVQYIHASRRRVRNQVWAALSHDGLGFPNLLIYRQDKQQPALHEERELERLNHLTLVPEVSWPISGLKDSKRPVLIGPPIIQHGNFMFALLICSELTNIQYRAALRGGIDALFVPEWNKDINSFEPLVESAALDIHAYIIQCNDRQYGDSRIRAPYKEAWQRDLIRVKGGLDDYYVVGEIDYQELRNFQSSYRSPDAPFKPVPDGFQIAHERKGIIDKS